MFMDLIKKITIAGLSAVMVMQVMALPVSAQVTGKISEGLNKAAAGAYGTNPQPIESLVGGLISVALGIVGLLLLGLFIYAGFKWMTAGGDATKIKEATALIRNAIIGLVIIVAAYAITSFVVQSLSNVTTGTGTPQQTQQTP